MKKFTLQALKRAGLMVYARREGLESPALHGDAAKGEMSFSDLQQKLCEELTELEKPEMERLAKESGCNSCLGSLWIQDLFPSSVVYPMGYDLGSQLFERTYEIQPDGTVKFGERSPVERKTTYVPDENEADALKVAIQALGDALPLAQRGVVMMHPSMLDVHPDIQHKKIKDQENNTTGKEEDQPENYDVDKGGTLLGWKDGYQIFVADGHHRRKLAITAKNVVSSKLGGKGEPVPVDRHVPVRILDSEDGWTLDKVKELGASVNAKKAEADTDSLLSDLCGDEFEIAADAKSVKLPDGVLGRVRQVGTMADSVNKNDRIYPTAVVNEGVDEALPRARARAMLSEMEHPDVVKTKKGEQFVDNYDAKTAHVIDISKVGSDKKLWVTLDILDTVEGRPLWDRYKATAAKRADGDATARPPTLSSRFSQEAVSAKVDGKNVRRATKMRFHTWDHVRDPAVDATREFQLLTDAQLTEAGVDTALTTTNSNLSDSSTHDQPEFSGDGNTRAQGAGAPEVSKVKSEIQRLIKAFNDAVGAKSEAKVVTDARTAASTAIIKGLRAGDKLQDECKSFVDAIVNMELSGYDSDSAPTLIMVNAGGGGYAPDVAAGAQEVKPMAAATLDNEGNAFIKGLMAKDAAAQAETARVDAATKFLGTKKEALEKLSEDTRKIVVDHVQKHGRDEQHAEELYEDQVEMISKITADAELVKKGVAKGNTVDDQGKPGAALVVSEAKPWRAVLDKFLTAQDNLLRLQTVYETNPDDEITKSRRKHNWDTFLAPMIDTLMIDRAAKSTVFSELMSDSVENQEKSLEKAFADAAVGDSTTLANVYNQPTILAFIMVQIFQDLKMLQYVQPFIGPGSDDAGFKFEAGNIVKIASEYFTDAAGYGVNSGVYDAGNEFPEDTGIDEAVVGLAWLTYGTTWRRAAVSLTQDLIKAMKGGPLSYDAIARHLMHTSARLGRAIDKKLADEMLNISDEYQAVAVVAQTNTTGNSRLPNNSTFNGGGSQVVNLNPAKTAIAAVAAGDPSVTYGTNVLAALRLLTRGAGTAAPYAGTTYGVDPIVRPRAVPSMGNSGQITYTTQNAVSISAPAAQVLGYLDKDLNIQTFPGGGAAATYAVDWENGVVLFNAGAGLAGAAGVLTTTITISYSYATNFDNFTVTPAAVTLGDGITFEEYLDGLLTQMKRSSATMGSAPRLVRPDLALMSLNAAVNVEAARSFDKQRSPNGTVLFPTQDFFASINGVNFARHNTPWYSGDTRILLTRRGGTKYGIETPLEVSGPHQSYDSSGRVKAKKIWYAEQNEVIATPQPVDGSGNILNPLSRTIRLR